MFFEYPYLLWLLAIPLLLLALYVWKEVKERRPHLRVSTITPWKAGGSSILGIVRHLPEALRLAAHKLPITTKFIKREAVAEEANTEMGGEEQ